jgi:hypothetical protein
MIALVSTFVAQGLLIRIREPSVPGEKVSSVVNLDRRSVYIFIMWTVRRTEKVCLMWVATKSS